MTIFFRIKDYILPSKANNYRSKLIQSKALLYFVIALLILKMVVAIAPINFPKNIFFADITKSALEGFVNQARQSVGLKPLSENQALNQAAQLKAQNMVQNEYFNHTSPSGVSPWYWFSEAGYKYKYAGENLAIGFYDSEEVYQAWLNSPSHKANILSPNYTEFGTAVVSGFGRNNSVVVVQEFGSPIISQKPIVTSATNKEPAQDATIGHEPVEGVQVGEDNATEKVLSETDENTQTIMVGQIEGEQNNSFAKALNYVIYNYGAILQNIVYGACIVVIGVLLAIIMLSFNIKFKKQLVYRAILIIVLLSAATIINKELVISLIPHKIII